MASQHDEFEIRIAHSESSNNKIWVTLTTPEGDVKATGFNKHDINQILQVDEFYYEDLTPEEAEDPLIEECRAALTLGLYHSEQFFVDPEHREVVTYLDAEPTQYISTKHIEKALDEMYDATEWTIYDEVKPLKRTGAKKAAAKDGSKPQRPAATQAKQAKSTQSAKSAKSARPKTQAPPPQEQDFDEAEDDYDEFSDEGELYYDEDEEQVYEEEGEEEAEEEEEEGFEEEEEGDVVYEDEEVYGDEDDAYDSEEEYDDEEDDY